MKTKLALPTTLRNSAASPNLALPRTILKSTWGQRGRRVLECIISALIRRWRILHSMHLPSTCHGSGSGPLLSVYGIRQKQTLSKYSYLCRNLLDEDTHIWNMSVGWVLHFIIISSCRLPPGYITKGELVQDFLYKTRLFIHMFSYFNCFVSMQIKVTQRRGMEMHEL